MNVSGERLFAAPRATVWERAERPGVDGAHMPGVESFDVHDDRRWTANMKIPLGLGGLKMKVDMEKTEERALEYAKMHIKGNGVGAMMNMVTTFDSATTPNGTTMKWRPT